MQKIECLSKLDQGEHGQPIWIETTQSLFWADHQKQYLYQYSVRQSEIIVHRLDSPVINLSPSIKHGFIATLKDGIGFFDLKQKKVTYISKPEPFHPNKIVGGITDTSGNYWSYTTPETAINKQANLYQITPNLEMRRYSDAQWQGTSIPVLSRDGKKLYQCSKDSRYIYAIHLDNNGKPTETDVICRTSKSEGYPNSLTLDEEDNIWVSHKEVGLISCYKPDGNLVEKIKLSVTGIEYCAFGGENMDTLFAISSIADEFCAPRKKALSSALLAIDVGTKGVNSKSFAG